jgi:hypothetical protein
MIYRIGTVNRHAGNRRGFLSLLGAKVSPAFPAQPRLLALLRQTMRRAPFRFPPRAPSRPARASKSSSRAQRAGARIPRLQGARRGKVLLRPQGPAQLRRAKLRRPASRSTSAPGSSACTTSRPISGGACATSSAASLPTKPATASASSRQAGQAQPGRRRNRVRADSAAQREPARGALEARNAARLVSETQQLPIDGLSGRLPHRSHRWHLQGLHRRHRHQHCRCGAVTVTAARSLRRRPQTGAPVEKADVCALGQRQAAVVRQDRQRRPGLAP